MGIYFLRHLKTEYNYENRISGCTEASIIPGQQLIYDIDILPKFRLVLCSTMSRCRDTVKLLPSEYYDDIKYTDALRERNVGVLEGLTKAAAVDLYPQYFTNGKIDTGAVPKNGESVSDVAQRLYCVSEYLKNIPDTVDVLICSHNQTLKVLYSLLMNIEVTNDYWYRLNFKNGTIINIDDIQI